MDKKFKGVYTVVCTAFDEKGNVDEQALRRLIRFQLDDCKVNGIIPCGSTGEFAFMTPQELNRLSPSPLNGLKEWCCFCGPLRVQPAR